MLIANPIYDSVFKYLLDDLDIARELLAVILRQEIEHIEVKPQETLIELESHSINLLRLDFKAIIRATGTGERRTVLIELQKAKQLLDVMRFRRYLGSNYMKEETILSEDGVVEKVPLPIVTVYFLGFKLAAGFPAVAHLNGQVEDVVTGQCLENRPREPFVDLLNHESYMVQIPLLPDGMQTRVEKVLSVFRQENLSPDEHEREFRGDLADPLLRKMVERLNRAVADEALRRKMDAEDTTERLINRLLREKDVLIAEKDALIAVLKQKLGEQN